MKQSTSSVISRRRESSGRLFAKWPSIKGLNFILKCLWNNEERPLNVLSPFGIS